MEPNTKANFEARAKVLKAMGNATRLFIVNELADGEKCVCELQEKIGSDMSTVSKHLSVLREAGILASRKNGNQVFYSLRCPCVLQFFKCIESVLRTSAQDTIELMG
ncbi:MAG: metalloregulator ArsR/SmtB family transcription factor [Gemmatimonadales bacterium]|nr:metalloregulator ArsR/SmtB family transcription factor [Gemmatimonadales bacterium]